MVSNSSPAAADFTVLTHSPTTAAKRHQLQLQLQTASGQKCEREKKGRQENKATTTTAAAAAVVVHTKKSGTTVEEKKKKKGKRGENGAKYW